MIEAWAEADRESPCEAGPEGAGYDHSGHGRVIINITRVRNSKSTSISRPIRSGSCSPDPEFESPGDVW